MCSQEISRELDLKRYPIFIHRVRNQEIGAFISGRHPKIYPPEPSLDVVTDHELPGMNCEQWPHSSTSNVSAQLKNLKLYKKGTFKLLNDRLIFFSIVLWQMCDSESRMSPFITSCYVGHLLGTVHTVDSMRPSRSKTRRTSSKAADMFPLGNLIWPNPSILLNRSQPSSTITTARVKPRRPWNRPAS